MAATFTFTLQGTSPTVIANTDSLQFAGAGFDTPVAVGEYNSSMHVKTSGGTNKSASNTPRNNKFISATQVDWGTGVQNLSAISTANSALKINFTEDIAVATSGAKFYAFDGTTIANGPTGVTFKAAQRGNSSWVDAEGSGSPLSLADQTSATSHDYFIPVSASPDSVGLKSNFALRFELTYV